MTSGPTIVLLPGLDGTGRMFGPFVERCPRGWDTQIVSYPRDPHLGYAELQYGIFQPNTPGFTAEDWPYDADLDKARTLASSAAGTSVTLAIVAACAASEDENLGAGGANSAASAGSTTTGSQGGGGEATSNAAATSTSAGIGGGDFDGGSGSGGACAQFTAEATQAPAAMLMALDASASMAGNSKWGTAQLAIATAIDKDVFDTMSLGLVTFPQSKVPPPQCLCGGIPNCGAFIQVGCGISALAQIPLTPAGIDKTNSPTGVRHDIYQFLVTHNPINDGADGSPIYEALVAGYNALKLYNIEKRLLVLITDGGFSCTSLSSPQRPGYYDGACFDWEYPDTVNALIKGAHDDPTTPINTFIVGVPGSGSTGANQNGYATAPYHMKLALSTYAVSGSPETIDPACDSSAVFTQGGSDPVAPCHIDLSNGAAFDANALATAIEGLRGQALGCVYDLPPPPAGETIDLALVNVDVTLDGVTSSIPRRSDPSDDCAVDGCWDYNAANQVEILGKTCGDIGVASSAKVDLLVGCETVLK